ncbi:hypothetical protein [Acidipila sp. EB88]|uniref:hypothetical protein n=1 Tax=Acidipila sp. EB88 TaxID=2305226 RepID=UPI000F5DCFCF|nr:hypothetical protein [Acidipila sp. EB88]
MRLLVLGLCCLLLVFLSAEVVHSHATGMPDATHCQWCVAAHLALQVFVLLAASLRVVAFGRVRHAGAVQGACAPRDTPCIRPPPAAPARIAWSAA